MKKIKYKVVYPGIKYIADIDAIYSGSDKTLQGIIQPLSVTTGEYIEESYAVTDSFRKSLEGGILARWIDKGYVVKEIVEEKDHNSDENIDPYAQSSSLLKTRIEHLDPTMSDLDNSVDSVIDWNKLTIEQKRKLMINEEIKEKEKKEVIDWNKLTFEEKKALMAEEENRINRLPEPVIDIKATREAKDNHIKSKKLKVKKGIVEKKGVKKIVKQVLNYDAFNALKYQDKLISISQETNVELLEEIIAKSTQDMIKTRAAKRAASLRG